MLSNHIKLLEEKSTCSKLPNDTHYYNIIQLAITSIIQKDQYYIENYQISI